MKRITNQGESFFWQSIMAAALEKSASDSEKREYLVEKATDIADLALKAYLDRHTI